MKKYLSLFLVFLMTLFCFSGCGSQQNTSETASSAAETAASMVTKSDLTNTAKLKIVTTIFPEYDWVKSILGDQTENVELTMLLDNGVDLHSYQPTADDIAKISDCDLFIYVGGESGSECHDSEQSLSAVESRRIYRDGSEKGQHCLYTGERISHAAGCF